jgi:hypothetical protein
MQLIANKTTPCGYANRIGPLAVAAVPIWIDREVPVAHAWTMVIRGAVKLTGSINWTNGVARNSEDLNLVSSPAGRT